MDDHKGNLPTLVVSMHVPKIGGDAGADAVVDVPAPSGKIII
jgi:hypothetical protein